jgi:hypothetical protein
MAETMTLGRGAESRRRHIAQFKRELQEIRDRIRCEKRQEERITHYVRPASVISFLRERTVSTPLSSIAQHFNVSRLAARLIMAELVKAGRVRKIRTGWFAVKGRR